MASNANANPLLLSWVKEWWDVARERNSKGVTTYKHAHDSLKACPIAFEHPAELQKLKGFGPKLCERLTEKLREHCEDNGLPMPPHPSKRKRSAKSKARSGAAGDDDEEDEESPRPVKKKRTVKPYVPAYRSGAYAIVVALSALREDDIVGMTKNDLIQAAQPYCDASFTAPPDPTKFYTAWASMKTLAQKELVYERGRPTKRYALTDEGWEVANRIKETTLGAPALDSASRPTAAPTVILDLDEDDDTPAPPASSSKSEYANVIKTDKLAGGGTGIPAFTPIRLAPGLFTVELVLDYREVRVKDDRDYMLKELTKRGVKPIMRALDLGDAVWVAKCKEPGWLDRCGAEGDEVVLDWIVERKRLDDLITSIKDGRFHEQKFRLRRSGVKNVIYLVEEIAMDSTFFQRYEEAVQSALASVQVVNGYFLKKTQMMDESIRYLASMTKMLKKVYESKPLYIIPSNVITDKNYLPILKHVRETRPGVGHYISYPAFASLASKSDTMTLRDIYLKMLMCTRGVTGEKAIEIQKIWKTPNDFVKAFENCGTGEEGKKRKFGLVTSQLGDLLGRKKIPKVVSQKIAEVWGDA